MTDDDQKSLLLTSGAGLPALQSDILEKARKIISEGTPPNTKAAYASDLRYIMAWCSARGIPSQLPLTSGDVITFIVDHVEGMPEAVEDAMINSRAKREYGVPAISTVRRRLAMLSTAHNMAALPNPCADPQVRELLSRAVRGAVSKGWRTKKKTAAALDTLERLLATCDAGTPHDIRDRAMLLFGWSTGGRRRSEVAGATMDRLEPRGDDFVYLLGVTKTVQDEDTGYVPVAGRAAVAMKAWLALLGEQEGPLFRGIAPDGVISPTAIHPEGVARVVCRRAKRAGLDPLKFGGHSLRSGFMTEAGLQGVSLQEAMNLSTHRTLQVAAGYYQAGSALKNKGARLAG